MPENSRRVLPRVLITFVPTLAVAAVLRAQEPAFGSLPIDVVCGELATAGSPIEHVVLSAALATESLHSTLLRPLPEGTARRIGQSLRTRMSSGGTEACGSVVQPTTAQVWYNTAAARSDRDGGVWQGRGITAAVSAGLHFRAGALRASLRPLAFVSENRRYTPRPEPLSPDDLRAPVWGSIIDLPYRFGDGAYARLLPGESSAQVTWKNASIGATTASQQWGPMHIYPLLLGTEAQGYPRAFVEARDVALPGLRLTGQWQVGLLEASPFTQLPGGSRSRVASAFVGTVRIAAIELGGGRFFHVRRTPGALSLSTATLPFTGLLKNRSTDQAVGGYNQLASVFFRVAPSAAGVEVYGEFLRDDHNADTRDFIGEPDHASAYGVGLRRAWIRADRLTAVTLEYANGRISHLVRVRSQVPIYVHDPIAEGHTHEGQPLGSSTMLGGGGTSVVWSTIERTTATDIAFAIEAAVQDGEGGTWRGGKSGSYILRAGHSRMLRLGVFGVSVEGRLGYGMAGRSGLTLGISRR